MENYTIAESYLLPSKGLIYDEQINPNIRLRSMTTAEEQKRLALTDYPYKMLCEIIDDCMIDDVGISSYDMCVGDFQYCLYKLRTVTYGSGYNIDVVCPFCGHTSHEVIDLDELAVNSDIDKFNQYREFDLPISKVRVKLNVQTPRMSDRINERVKETKNKTNGKDMTLVYTLAALIGTIDGKSPDRFKLDDWVTNLPMADVNTIVTYAEKCNSLIGLNTKLILTCDVCHLMHNSQLSMNQEFFRPALDI